MVELCIMLQQQKKIVYRYIHLQKIMQSFKEENSAWPSVGVIVVDKDFTEWKILKEEFPEASILFCQWHVMKATFKKVVN